jgi:hypothetical protein
LLLVLRLLTVEVLLLLLHPQGVVPVLPVLVLLLLPMLPRRLRRRSRCQWDEHSSTYHRVL